MEINSWNKLRNNIRWKSNWRGTTNCKLRELCLGLGERDFGQSACAKYSLIIAKLVRRLKLVSSEQCKKKIVFCWINSSAVTVCCLVCGLKKKNTLARTFEQSRIFFRNRQCEPRSLIDFPNEITERQFANEIFCIHEILFSYLTFLIKTLYLLKIVFRLFLIRRNPTHQSFVNTLFNLHTLKSIYKVTVLAQNRERGMKSQWYPEVAKARFTAKVLRCADRTLQDLYGL